MEINTVDGGTAAPFDITPDKLQELVFFSNTSKEEDKQKKLAEIAELGGLKGIAESLKTDLVAGLPHSDNKRARGAWFGINVLEPPPAKNLFSLILEAFQDRILQILLVGAIVTLALGLAFDDGWIDGIAIFVAVFIVVSVTAGNDWLKDKKFRKILMMSTDQMVTVRRNGEQMQINSKEILVGEVLELAQGDEITADGIFIDGNKCSVDESPLTGEPLPVKKNPEKPFMFSGTHVSEGSCTMLVTTVGERSCGGQIQTKLNEAQKQRTPLQDKLEELGNQIGYCGFLAGGVTFGALMIRWIIDVSGETWEWEFLKDVVHYFVLAITMIVVTVPEGLPLAVTISLAYSMRKMIKDNNFVRHLAASETMGEATCICSDKTGTLTENRMTVTNSVIGGVLDADTNRKDLTQQVIDMWNEGVAMNSTCFIQNKDSTNPVFVGSKTEGALLIFSHKFGGDYARIRSTTETVETYAFSSDRKRMSTCIKTPTGFRVHCKGASEVVLALCTRQLARDGSIQPMDAISRKTYDKTIIAWASEGLRTLTLAYRDFPTQPSDDTKEVETDLVFLGLVGIKDPVREEVPPAVRKCQQAGLTVKMVTGDNLLTAKKIASECNIYTEGGLCMEGPEFRKLSREQKMEIVQRLQVLARAIPTDKFELVSALKALGEVVAVTGDGTNDAIALKEADVGFAMGISGTQIAKHASDIVLLDDNFRSISRAIMWGRNVFDCIRKFLQFQLGVNAVAVLITIVSAVSDGEAVLSSVQLLWVNLIMDTFGALALATDPPTEAILQRKPHKRDEGLITRYMMLYVVFTAVYQLFALLFLYFQAYHWFGHDGDDEYKYRRSLVFTAFILMQVVNETNARILTATFNPFVGIDKNPYFPGLMLVIVGIQILMVQFGGDFANTMPLNILDWIGCSIIALGGLPVGLMYRFVFRMIVKNKPEHVPIPAKEPSVVYYVPNNKSNTNAWAKLRVAVMFMALLKQVQKPSEEKVPFLELQQTV